MSFSSSAQQGQILQAYTLKADGRHIDAPPANFQVDAAGGQHQGPAAFSDRTTLTLIFPDLAVGDTAVWQYRERTIEPIFAGQFSALDTFMRTQAYDEVKVSVDAPQGLALGIQTTDLEQLCDVAQGGRRLRSWVWHHPEAVLSRRHDFSVFEPQREPGIAISTFASYGDIARAYGAAATPKARVTPQIRALADQITRGLGDTRAQARALYEWVATHISYAGNQVGVGTVVPRDLEFVMGNHLGDCKDHATLLQALLSAKGIHSTQALINADSSYRLQSVPVVAMVNHVINYIPSLDLYLDSTSSSTPFGMLPFADADKPTLLVEGYSPSSRTPRLGPGQSVQRSQTQLSIDEDGRIEGQTRVDLTGLFAADARAFFRQLNAPEQAELMQRYFQQQGIQGQGQVSSDDPQDLSQTFHYAATFKVLDPVDVPGPGAFGLHPMVFSQMPVLKLASNIAQPLEDTDFVACLGAHVSETYVVDLPAAIEVLALPADMDIASGPYHYVASYAQEGRRLHISRRLDDDTVGNVCPTTLLIDNQRFVDKVLRNVRAQVVFRPSSSASAGANAAPY